jgi:hypothetical protein
MLVCESRDSCISIWMVAKSSIRHLSHLIPSIEFSPTSSPQHEEKLFIHSNPLKQVHIIYRSVTKLSMVERLVLLHLLGATDGNVVVVRGHRNVIVCKIVDWHPPGLMRWRHEWRRPCGVLWSITEAWARASAGQARQERSLHPTYQFLHLAQHMQQQQVPITLGVSVSISRMDGRKQSVV